jgi:hypothetical protein
MNFSRFWIEDMEVCMRGGLPRYTSIVIEDAIISGKSIQIYKFKFKYGSAPIALGESLKNEWIINMRASTYKRIKSIVWC